MRVGNAAQSYDELQRQLAALERSLADLTAAGMDEGMLAPLQERIIVLETA